MKTPVGTLGYLWASPCTAIGLVLASLMLLAGASVRFKSGVIEVGFADPSDARAQALLRLPFAGITFGHVVLAVTHELQDSLRLHERAHVAQYERWGPLLLLAYPLSSLVQVVKGGHPYLDNCFELQARAAEMPASESRP